jgi:hypothetical protein
VPIPLVAVKNITIRVSGWSTGNTGLRIAHISDFHFRRWNGVIQAAQDLLLTLEYDLLVATGDFGTVPRHWTRAVELMWRFFEPIAQRAPAYGVLGNHDYPGPPTNASHLPLKVLRNESVLVECSGACLELAGVDQTTPEAEDLPVALGTPHDHRFTVLLAHYPSTVLRLPPARVGLQLSGHTHGGQIRFPYLGCLWTNDRITRRMARGLHRVAETFLYVSSGIGVSWPIPLRIHCPPEVTIITLKPAARHETATQTEELAAVAGGNRNKRLTGHPA